MVRRRSAVDYVVDENGCWIWQLARNSKGYGTRWDRTTKRLVQAHRWYYEQAFGPIPEGMWIDHLCKTKACVNPDHLEPVTPRMNAERHLYPNGRPAIGSAPPIVRRVDSQDCILWERARDGRGYGAVWDGKRVVGAHRLAYERANGPIPPGMEIDHLCRNTLCVNPDHLEAVSPGENKRRANWRSTCKRGHPLTPENCVWNTTTGKRKCRTCAAERNARYERERRKRRNPRDSREGERSRDERCDGLR
jgi:HNH endonuclease